MMGKAKAAYERCQRKRCAVFALREVNLPAGLPENRSDRANGTYGADDGGAGRCGGARDRDDPSPPEN